jgi:hypothetical protein
MSNIVEEEFNIKIIKQLYNRRLDINNVYKIVDTYKKIIYNREFLGITPIELYKMDDYDRFYKYILILLLIDSKKIDVYMGYVLLLTITDICDILGDNKIRNTSIEDIEKEMKELKDNFDLTAGDSCIINNNIMSDADKILETALANHAKNYNNMMINTENHNNVITSDYAYDESDDAYDDCDDWDRDDYEYFLEVISRDS